MKYKFKEFEKGKVRFILDTGSSFVRNEMTVAQANVFLKGKKITQSDILEGFEIQTDDGYFFEGTVETIAPKTKKGEV